ncbi:hypothetical protein KGD83_13720 [Nocardiopsis akebiae]|uniref:Uncharacterized protein n=1 Tax=Nocardiopsis akebiae TaxID=2831968 RepID=A0ABX8CFR4_9ACTN|nr:hypothetical protein [Nocardiopsis akebiae]QUX31448.1 hypothetical protein KGD83_13720 [Nocardiopsis akebiae]
MTNQPAESKPYRGFADGAPPIGSQWGEHQMAGVTLTKAFNAMFAGFTTPDPRHTEGHQAVLCARDDETARIAIGQMPTGFGFAPVALGGLGEGGALVQLRGP